ncbi:MAG TPA: fumarylacetoacetate hydrolase family protein [Steroidobacteraceae bacterium]|nr:fumarylacetoacetate hydrolase family protein [Steroidobacteraceae bacterium]
MKLASRRKGRDGELLVVARDLSSAVSAAHIAPTLQAALDAWENVEPALKNLYALVNAGTASGQFTLDQAVLDAPLPRAWQWLDGSAYPQHGELMATAFSRPKIEISFPLMYQGLSHHFLGTGGPVPFPSEEDGIDFEGEFAVVTSDVPMAASRQTAAESIRLLIQVNDWSLRKLAAQEVKTGFGWLMSKPACAAAPIAITPDELGSAWRDSRLHATLEVRRGEEIFGRVPANEMAYGFDELIVHAARTRDLCAGTIIGSGTVSSSRYAEVGSCCISERQAIEMIAHGAARTRYLQYGERVRMTSYADGISVPLFGILDSAVVRPAT